MKESKTILLTDREFYLEENYVKSYINKIDLITNDSELRKALLQRFNAKEVGTTIIFQEESEIEDIYILSIVDNVAYIEIKNELVKEDTWYNQYFGFTSYPSIMKAIDQAESKLDVKKIVFNIDSPGGIVAGVDEVAIRIRNIKKSTEAVIQNLGASAAYYLASQADKITALSPTTSIGSIGVIIWGYDDTERLKEYGLKEIILRSTEAPNKAPQLKDKSGQQKLIKHIDDLHAVFIRRIAEGRGLEESFVNESFGKGATFLSKEALSVGMIDNIIDQLPEKSDESGSQVNIFGKGMKNEGQEKEVFDNEKNNDIINVNEDENTNEVLNNGKDNKNMNLEELKASHKDVYDQAVALGMGKEKDRITSLQNWSTHNPETSEIVKNAISEGKAESEVMSELMACVKNNTTKIAAVETPENISSVKNITTATSEQNTPKKEDEEVPADIEQEAKSIAENLNWGGVI